MNRRIGALCVSALMFTASACREMPAPPTEPERTEAPQAFPLQLTFSIHDDRSPSWSADGDTVFYAAHTAEVVRRPVARLRAIPRTAGIAELMFPDLGADADSAWLADPAPAPNGAPIAFAQIQVYSSVVLLPGTWTCVGEPAATVDSQFAPNLAILRLHARAPGSGAPLFQSGTDPIFLDGRRDIADVTFLIRYSPFQRLWESERVLPFNPSWSPDGAQLVYSDGLRVLTWTPGAFTDAQPIPNSNDGVRPAWSPDGSRIAYTRLERADSARARCIIPGQFGPSAIQERIVYQLGDRRLITSSLDGGSITDLGIGEDPAWSPDGRFIYAVRDDAVWRIAVDGSNAIEIPGTDQAREPAVSPDGRHLAVARKSPAGDYDIWVVGID